MAFSEIETGFDVQNCEQSIREISNADNSIFKIYDTTCKSTRTLAVKFQKSGSVYEELILQDVTINPSEHKQIGYQFKDINNDGIFEIDYSTGCGAVNCGHKIYKLKENYSQLYAPEDYIYLLIEDSWYNVDFKENYVLVESRGTIKDYYSRIYLLNDDELQLPISYEVHNKTHVDDVKYCLIKKYIQSDSKGRNASSFVFLAKEEANEELKNFCEAGSIITTEEPRCTELTPC